ncbi:MAG: hypothetical protein ACOCXX_03870, partial [Planctomycetota bacterium]
MNQDTPDAHKASHDLDDLFRYPPASPTCYGRSPVVAVSGKVVWAAIQKRQGGREFPMLVRTEGDRRRQLDLPSQGQCYQVAIDVDDQGHVHLLASEVRGDQWVLTCRVLDDSGAPISETVDVTTPGGAIRHPSIVCTEAGPVAVWSQLSGGRFRIHTLDLGDPSARPTIVSSDRYDAHRPHLAHGGGRLVLAWDEADGPRHHVCVVERSGSDWSSAAVLSHPAERWFCPRVAVSGGGRAYVTWVVLAEVMDELGILDHLPFAMAARLDDGEATVLEDPVNPTDRRIAADLREGLLASRAYRGYHGLRRNPWPVARDDGLDLYWEVRLEREEDHLFGHLTVRRYADGKGWSEPRMVHHRAHTYVVAGGGDAVAAAFFEYDPDPSDVVRAAWIDPDAGEPYVINPDDWSRWRRVEVTSPRKPRQTVDADGTTYNLYWADTHCHSVLSPDAEGEPDELVSYARHMAGLDVLAVADNDYYPHKELTDAEWRLHRDLASHYSEPGRFLWMPAYEYCYHRAGLKPDFNHRIIIYPSYDGPLYRRTDAETAVDAELFRHLAKTDCICYPHHPTYEIQDNELDRNVEVCSSWRVVLGEVDFTYRQLNRGLKLGFIGSSDSHRAVPGRGGA